MAGTIWNRWRNTLGIATALGVAASSGVAAPSPSTASPNIERFEQLSDKVIADFQGNRGPTGIPLANDPDVSALHGEADALGPALATRQFSLGLAQLLSLCERAGKISAAYLSARVESDAPAGETTTNIGNAARYFEEIYPLAIFGLHCSAATVPLMVEFVATLPSSEMTPVRRQGLEMVRTGIADQVRGLLLIAADRTIGPVRTREALQTLAARAPLVGQAMTDSQKGDALRMLDELAVASPVDKPTIERISAALKAASCTRLCE
jgi:hypothetical protein